MQKIFEWIGETYALEPNFIKFAALQITQHYTAHSVTVTSKFYRVYLGKQSLEFLFSDKCSAFKWKLQYYYCIASSVSIHAHFFKIKIL